MTTGVRATELRRANVLPREHGAPGSAPSGHDRGHPFLPVKRAAGNAAVQRRAHSGCLQKKLEISLPGDAYEQEADRVAEHIVPSVRQSGSVHRCACGGTPGPDGECDACRATRLALTRRSGGNFELARRQPAGVPTVVSEALQSSGQPLDPSSRAFFESRLGFDFSRVRIHADAQAVESARALSAEAYTIGQDIVFGTEPYAPETTTGIRLLAHELTHVAQQEGSARLDMAFQRGGTGQPLSPVPGQPPVEVPASAVQRDAPNAKTWTGALHSCGPDFCRPFPSEGFAVDDRDDLWPLLMVGIGYKVSPRVLPLWNQWAYGGSSSVENLTAGFGSEFSDSPTTVKTTKFLLDRIKAKLTSSPPTIPPAGFLKLDIPTLIPADVKAIDDPKSPNQMNFNVPSDIPGNLAGGIGKDEAATPVGKNPSPQNDERIAKGDILVFPTPSGLATVPNLSYTVKDTIDLCPGDCGEKLEQKATIPMSRWEATGISGDVPFVDFPAPYPYNHVPFAIPNPGAPAASPAGPVP